MPQNQSCCFIRPEQMCLTENPEFGIPVKVVNSRFAGVYYEYFVASGSTDYRIIEINTGNTGSEWQIGDEGYLSLKKGWNANA